MQFPLLTGIDQELATVLPNWKLRAMHIQLISLSHKERNKANNIAFLAGDFISISFYFFFFFCVKVRWSGAQMLLSWFTAFLAKQVYFSFVYS